MAGFDRSRISLGRRTQQQTDTRESNGGMDRPRFMDYRSCKLKFFKMADVGTYHDLNILPWRIGTKLHPEVISNNAKVGDYDYVLDLMVHTNIGPSNGDYICLKKNFGKACPICEEADELWKNDDTKDDARKLFARRKCIYLVQELSDSFKPKSEDPEIFEVSHAVFSKELQSRATACLRGKGVVNFADPGEEGKVVSFSVNEDTMGSGKKFKKAGNFEFNERVEEISDEILEKCPSLDAMMVVKTYDQLKAALYGDPDDSDEAFENQQDDDAEEQAPARFRDNPPARFDAEPAEETPTRRRRAPEPEEAEQEAPARRRRAEPEESADEGTPTRRRRAPEPEEPADEAPARRRRPAESEEDAPRSRKQESEETPYEEARRSSRKAVEETRKEKDDVPKMPFDDDDAPAETEEAPKEKPAPSRGDSANTCPNGYEFGKDCDRGQLCGKCPDALWAKCDACRSRLKK